MMFLSQSTAVDVGIGPFVDSTDGFTAETGLTIAQADVRLKKNNGAWAQVNDATSATHEENGWYEKELDATDTNTVGILLIAVNESGALPVWQEYQVLEEAVYDALFAASAPGYGTAQTGDSFARLGAPAGASIAADIAVIEAQTDDIGAAGAGLTALASQASVNTIDDFLDTEVAALTTELAKVPKSDGTASWNATALAALQSEANDALVAYDAATGTDVTTAAANVSVDEIQATALADLFNTDSATTYASAVAGSVVKEIADNAGGSSLTAAAIADEVQTRTIAAVTVVNGLAANVITAAATAADFTTEIQSGLATAAALATVDDFLDTEISALTTELAKVPKSDGTATWNATALASLQAEATDALNAYDGPTNAELATALGTADDAVLAQVALVKAKTDSLTFTVAGKVDANITHVIADPVQVNGATDTNWGGAP